MSNVDSILSKLGYPSIPKDGSSIISNVISSKSNIGSPSMAKTDIQLMSNLESSFAPSISEDSPSVMNSVQLCLVDFNVSPYNMTGGGMDIQSDVTALMNKPYTLMIGILYGTLELNSNLSVNGSDGSVYKVSNSITDRPDPYDNPGNIYLFGEVTVSSNTEKIVTYTIISNDRQIDYHYASSYKINWVESLPPAKLSKNPKCPIGTWSKIDITFTLDEFFNPFNITPSPAIMMYNQSTNNKMNKYLGMTNTLDNLGKYYIFMCALTHGFSYNRICNISMTPNFTSSTISPTSIITLSFIITDINLKTETEVAYLESILPNNKISHKCIGDWLKTNFKTVNDLVYINPSRPGEFKVINVPSSCSIENFSIDVKEVTFSPPTPSTPPTPSNTSSSYSSLMYVIIVVVILGLYFMFRPKRY
jgi:hypothetical protein